MNLPTIRDKHTLFILLFLATLLISPSPFVHAQADLPPTDPSVSIPAEIIAADETDYGDCGGQAPAPVNSAFEQQVVTLVNAERTSRGLPPLKRVAALDQAARYHAKDMQQDKYFNHDTYDRVDGQLCMSCSMGSRLTSFYPSWSWLGENIASGYLSPQNVVASWMGSPGHQQNILRTEFREIGVGYYTGNYWVQDFGQQNNVFPLVINNEASATNTNEVSLYLYNRSATYGWTEMRLRNDGLAWTSWMPYQTSFQWELPNTIGEHTVSAEMRWGAFTSSSSDSIYLNTVGIGAGLSEEVFIPLLLTNAQ